LAPVHNPLLLALFIIAAMVYFTGLGWLLVGIPSHGSLIRKKADVSIIQEFAVTILVGMILNYGLVVVIQNLTTSLSVGICLGIIGLVSYIVYLSKQIPKQKLSDQKVTFLLLTFTLLVVLLGPIIVEPLRDWDARSIWFLHAKMIYSAGTIGFPAGWTETAITWSHPDYPKFIPALAAQIAFIFGFWNEYLPKLSLFLTLVPGFIFIINTLKRQVSDVLLFLMVPFSFFPYVWNGYMDGILAFYFAITLIFMIKWSKSNNPTDLFTGICSMTFLMMLKNEGILAFISIIISIILFLFFYRKKVYLKPILSKYWRYFIAICILLIPFLAWLYLKSQWGLQSDLEIGTRTSILQIISRLGDGSWKMILKAEYRHISINLLIAILAFLASLRWKIPAIKDTIPILAAAGVYFLGITFIYLLTPRDLNWHLDTSIERTMMMVNAALIYSWYEVISKIEKAQRCDEI